MALHEMSVVCLQVLSSVCMSMSFVFVFDASGETLGSEPWFLKLAFVSLFLVGQLPLIGLAIRRLMFHDLPRLFRYISLD